MKRIIKSIARAGWAGIGPVRRPLVRKFHLLMNDRHASIVDEVDQRVAQHFHTALAAWHHRGPLPVRRADRPGAEAARHSRSSAR